MRELALWTAKDFQQGQLAFGSQLRTGLCYGKLQLFGVLIDQSNKALAFLA